MVCEKGQWLLCLNEELTNRFTEPVPLRGRPLSNNGTFGPLCCVAMLGEDAVLWLLTSEVLRFYPPWRTVFVEHESYGFQAKAYCSPKKT